MALIVRDPPVPPSPVGLYVSDSVSFLPAGTGALTTRTVRDALRAIARSGDYDTAGHFNTAVDALTETIGMRNIRIGTTAAGGTMIFPARTTGRGQQIFSSFDLGPFLGDPDPVIFWGYNCTQTAGFAQTSEPRMYWAVEGYYNDGSGDPKMESYLQIDGLTGQGSNQFRPWYCIANRDTAAILVRYASDLHQFFPADLTGGSSVLDVYGAGSNGILAHKKVTIDTITANSGLGLTLADNSGTPVTVNFTPSWSVNGGAPALVTGGAYGISISAGGTENLRMPYVSGAVNFIVAHGSATTGISVLATDGSDTDIALGLASKGTDPINLYTAGAFTASVISSAALQVQITHTASASRFLTLTGSNGGNPTISTSAGNVAITPAVVGAASIAAHGGTAIPAGGTAGAGLLVSSTTNFGVFFGSGAPSLSAAKGSLYLRSDGTGTTDRAYINTNGSTTWTALTTVA